MLVCARLRHMAGTQWGNKKYMSMKRLEVLVEDVTIVSKLYLFRRLRTIYANLMTLPWMMKRKIFFASSSPRIA